MGHPISSPLEDQLLNGMSAETVKVSHVGDAKRSLLIPKLGVVRK